MRSLPAALWKTEFEFAYVVSVTELTGGDLLVSDERDRRIVRVSDRGRSLTEASRRGDGPGEFRQPGLFLSVSADSVLLADQGARRWVVFGASRRASTIGPADVSTRLVPTMRVIGSDTLGFVYAVADPSLILPATEDVSHRLPLVRVHRRTGAVDTVTFLRWDAPGHRAPSVAPAAAAGGRGREFVLSVRALDQVAVAPDGWIVVVRISPYRIDWCGPKRASCSTGAPIEPAARPWSDKDKKSWLQRRNEIGAWPPTTDPAMVVGWPKFLPAVVQPDGQAFRSAALITPSRGVAVRRVPRADDTNVTYDVFARDGSLVGRVGLPFQSELVGFGRDGLVYVVTTDDQGLQSVSAHRWPIG